MIKATNFPDFKMRYVEVWKHELDRLWLMPLTRQWLKENNTLETAMLQLFVISGCLRARSCAYVWVRVPVGCVYVCVSSGKSKKITNMSTNVSLETGKLTDDHRTSFRSTAYRVIYKNTNTTTSIAAEIYERFARKITMFLMTSQYGPILPKQTESHKEWT